MMPVFIYLLAVVLANMIILWFGPQAAVITAFLFIGLDLTLRDKLHDQWHGKQSCWDSLSRNSSGAFCGHLYCKNILAKTKQKFNLSENKS